jgi:hypothetical protein
LLVIILEENIMSKKFNKEDIEFVLDKINGWEGDLTWLVFVIP